MPLAHFAQQSPFGNAVDTVMDCLSPVINGAAGDIAPPRLYQVPHAKCESETLFMLPGDPAIFSLETTLGSINSFPHHGAPTSASSIAVKWRGAFLRMLNVISDDFYTTHGVPLEYVIVDFGPNAGELNKACAGSWGS